MTSGPEIVRNVANWVHPHCTRLFRDSENRGDAAAWGASSALRQGWIVLALLRHLTHTSNAPRPLSVLNASGLQSGHLDFPLLTYLRTQHSNRFAPITWTALESPASPFLSQPALTAEIERLNITLRLVDFRHDPVVCRPDERFDVVLLTQIAEHLVHDDFLRLYLQLRAATKPNGIMVLSTPNAAYLAHRLRFLFTGAQPGYWGDGVQNMQQGLWGHITLYDGNRLTRLLADCGWRMIDTSTFNYMPSRPTRRFPRFLLHAATHLLNHAGECLQLIAQPSPDIGHTIAPRI